MQAFTRKLTEFKQTQDSYVSNNRHDDGGGDSSDETSDLAAEFANIIPKLLSK